jgi:hypothetical protein
MDISMLPAKDAEISGSDEGNRMNPGGSSNDSGQEVNCKGKRKTNAKLKGKANAKKGMSEKCKPSKKSMWEYSK